MNSSSQLRAALRGERPVQVIGAHNGLGARLAEEAGFDAVWASGLEISTAAGVPDANILSMSELLAVGAELQRATRLPVICDCDTGFGNSNNVIHMVKCYEAAGVAAVCMEDKRFPKVNSFVPGRQDLAPIAEFVGKVMAAKSAQRSDDFVVIARVEALIAGWGMDEALKRAEAYARAGADAILIHSKQRTPDEVLTFLERWQGRAPVVVVPTTYPQLSASELKAAGADMVIYANHGLRAGIGAVQRAFAEIVAREGTMTLGDELVPLSRVFELQGMTRMKEQEKRYLRSGDKPVRVVVPAGGDLDLPADLAQIVDAQGPRALLDLYGKPLIERQQDAFARAGVQDVSLVGPYQPAQLPVGNLGLVPSDAGSLLGTVLAGLVARPCPAGGAVIVCYSDILFGAPVARRIVDCDADIGVLVDRGFREGGRGDHKALDYVLTEPPPAASGRVLDTAQGFAVQHIGKQIDPREAHFEFIGMLSLSEAGYAAVMQRCKRWATERASRPFGNAACFGEATLTDLLQELVDDGVRVTALEQDRGWMELHDFDDYKAAIEQLSRE